MKISVNENRDIQLEEVFGGVLLKTEDGETMGICMRDSGFEFSYNGRWYSAKGGILQNMEPAEKAKPVENPDGGPE